MSVEARLKRQGLLPSTVDKYLEILESSGAANSAELISWINRRVHAKMPIGTVLPARAAAKHFLLDEGYTEEQLAQLLPKARGRAAKERHALDPEQLALYLAAVEHLPEPAASVLALLPASGLRISEACMLRTDEIETKKGRVLLSFRGKRDKHRYVPLPRAAGERLLRAAEDKTDFVFTRTRTGEPIQPHGVRLYTRALAAAHTELTGLSPHILRHTYATMAVRKGVDLKTLQALLGHASVQTTSRYLHPTADDLVAAVDKL